MMSAQGNAALRRFVEDELLRAPLLSDQLVEATLDHVRRDLPTMSGAQRSAVASLMQALQSNRARLAEYFTRSLRASVEGEIQGAPTTAPDLQPRRPASQSLSLVDEDKVAVDVELSHMIEAIKSTAEYELRELQTYVAALVGDMDMARDHNPFRPEAYARAVWASAQALPLSRGHQVAYMRNASTPVGQLLRRSYAAATSRLEAIGVEPAAYRTLILPPGSRRGTRSNEITFTPDLYRMREAMSAPVQAGAPLSYEGQAAARGVGGGTAAGAAAAPRAEHWSEIARTSSNPVDRQSIELVSRLFEAMFADDRVPGDVRLIISRLHGPAMRLALRDGNMLDETQHALWRFIDRLAYEAEMTPDPVDPERAQLLKVAQATIDQLAAEPEQSTGLYRWALDRLESFLQKRLTRRVAAAASQIGALQKLEDTLLAGQGPPSTLGGTLDVPQLDTVPAELMDTAARPTDQSRAWLEALQPGEWVRMFLQGAWIQARLLWPGERREIWLFGDGASDDTWAVRRGALLMMHNARLAKTLQRRSIVGSAALRLQEEAGGADAAAGG